MAGRTQDNPPGKLGRISFEGSNPKPTHSVRLHLIQQREKPWLWELSDDPGSHLLAVQERFRLHEALASTFPVLRRYALTIKCDREVCPLHSAGIEDDTFSVLICAEEEPCGASSGKYLLPQGHLGKA